MAQALLKAVNITKSFAGVQALKGVSLEIMPGEVHCLAGENGCGKSTLIKVISGVHPRDGGTLEFNGQAMDKFTPIDAIMAGIQVIYQDFAVFPNLTVAENMFLGSLPHKGFAVDWKKLNDDANAALDELNSSVRGTDYVRDLPISQQQMVEIAKAVSYHARVLVLDEPTAGLDPQGREQLLDVIDTYRRTHKTTVLFVSHSMEDVAKYVDRIIVMNRGKVLMDDVPREIFKRYKELEEVGLSAPQVTYIMEDLKKKGLPVDTSVLTIEEARDEILRALRR